MKQRVQSILFFLSAIFFGLLFFMPLASYLNDQGVYYKLFVHEVSIVSPKEGFELPFGMIYTLPLLVFTVAIILINFYISMSLFRAVKLQQFVKLFKLSRINLALAVLLVTGIFVFYLLHTGTPVAHVTNNNVVEEMQLAIKPSFHWPAWGAFLTLVSLFMMLAASSGLRKDINKVRSADRLR